MGLLSSLGRRIGKMDNPTRALAMAAGGAGIGGGAEALQGGSAEDIMGGALAGGMLGLGGGVLASGLGGKAASRGIGSQNMAAAYRVLLNTKMAAQEARRAGYVEEAMRLEQEAAQMEARLGGG